MKIYAHRGSSTIWPENTMFAFEQAHKHGAEGFETDLRLSKDGEIMLAHDDNLKRFGLPDKTVSQLGAKESCQLKIPSLNKEHKANLISLRMLLERFPGKSYIFDCKITSQIMIEKLKTLLKELKFHHRIWFLTWSKEADKLIENHFPRTPYFPRYDATVRWALMSIVGMGNFYQPKHRILSLPPYFNGMPVFGKQQVQNLVKEGKTFLGYIVNTEKDFERCRQCGVEVVLTDRPDLISKLRGTGEVD